jgi:hypothetical protein
MQVLEATMKRLNIKLDSSPSSSPSKSRALFVMACAPNIEWILDLETSNIVTNLTRTLQSSRFLGGQVFYAVFKNGGTGSTPLPFYVVF